MAAAALPRHGKQNFLASDHRSFEKKKKGPLLGLGFVVDLNSTNPVDVSERYSHLENEWCKKSNTSFLYICGSCSDSVFTV